MKVLRKKVQETVKIIGESTFVDSIIYIKDKIYFIKVFQNYTSFNEIQNTLERYVKDANVFIKQYIPSLIFDDNYRINISFLKDFFPKNLVKEDFCVTCSGLFKTLDVNNFLTNLDEQVSKEFKKAGYSLVIE